MRVVALLASIVIALGVASLLQAEEVIKDKSPDKKFALQLTHGEEGWETVIVALPSKKKILDLEVLATSGDHERRAWAASVDTFQIEDYAKDARLVWSDDSQRVAYFNEDRDEHTMSVYFRNGDTFEGVALPELPRCNEIKDEDQKYLTTVSYTLTPKYWLEFGGLFVEVRGEWQTLKGQMIGCPQNVTLAFDAQHKASIKKAEEPPELIGQKIESMNGTFFVEELEVPAKHNEGDPDTDLEVWIVSAKDPDRREPLPGFHEKGFTHLNSVSISPDENWVLVGRHYGSHMNATYLFHRKEGLKFEDVFSDASFDNEAWKFLCKVENIPKSKIDATDDFPGQAGFLGWSDDSARLLIDLRGGLTGKDTYYRLEDFKKLGVSGWVAYYNTKTKKFELTDRLRKNNKGARKRWSCSADENAPEDGFVPPSAELIGDEGPDASVAERLKKYEAQLAAVVNKRELQLEGVDRAEFQKKEKDWREELENKAAKITDPQKRLGFRTRSTWYHLIDVRDERLPVYEKPKSAAEKQSQP